MSGDVTRPAHWDAAVSVVREFLDREKLAGKMRSRRTPVLVFTGPRGSGKSELLTEVAARLDQDTACAYINCAQPEENARSILSWLAFGLNRQWRGGQLPFPRLITGQIVTSARLTLDRTSRAAACAQVAALLEANQKTRTVLEDTIGAILKGAALAALTPGGTPVIAGGTPVAELVAKYGTKLVLGGMAASARGRHALFGTGLRWWGDQDRGLGHDPLDELVELRLSADRADAASGDSDAGREVARLLWAAFFADLRDGFQEKWWSVPLPRNCVVLLDSADTPAGLDFLLELETARQEREGEEPDPLTVVATSRGILTERIRGEGEVALADASYRDYLRRGRSGRARWWYPVAMPPLSWTQTWDMVRDLKLSDGNGRAIATAVHGFTAGHPGGTRTLLAAITDNPESALDLSALLTRPDPRSLSGDSGTVEAAILKELLKDVSAAAAADLVTCAAAPHRDAAERLAVAGTGLMKQLSGEEKAIFTADFWSARVPGCSPALHPMLRKLLLRRLAGRERGAQASWQAVHEFLRDRSLETASRDRERAAQHRVTELYHTLALGELRPVAELLAGLVEVSRTRDWLRLLARVTAAPCQLEHDQLEPDADPRAQMRRLTAWTKPSDLPLGPVARLAACSWLGNDPLSAPHWKLLLEGMASELEAVAPYCVDEGLAVVRDEAKQYRDIANGPWREVGEFWMAHAMPDTGTGTNTGGAG